MDEVVEVSPEPASPPPIHNTRNQKKRMKVKRKSQGDQTNRAVNEEAPTAGLATSNLKSRITYLEEKLSDVTSERDSLRTLLSDALASLKGAKRGRKRKTEAEKCESDGSSSSVSSSESSSSSSSLSSSSSPNRKRKKKGKGKSKKHGKQKKQKKKSKHHSRYRVGGPEGVVKRYKAILEIYRKGKNMAESFQTYGVDRLTVVNTAAIAELAIAAPEEFRDVDKGGTLSNINRRCQEAIKANPEIATRIKNMKEERKLLRISKKADCD